MYKVHGCRGSSGIHVYGFISDVHGCRRITVVHVNE
jgi:hypothetical protein